MDDEAVMRALVHALLGVGVLGLAYLVIDFCIGVWREMRLIEREREVAERKKQEDWWKLAEANTRDREEFSK